eukprot:Skav230539  [mRNA]  locus=scaffold1183:357481:369946:- [translate_table: standard]
MAGVAIGARVLAHFYVPWSWSEAVKAGEKPNRYKSPEPEEAVVLGVHYKDDDMAGPSQLEVELEFLRQDPTTLERTPVERWLFRCVVGWWLDGMLHGLVLGLIRETKKTTCVPSHWIVSTSEDAEVAAALREAAAPSPQLDGFEGVGIHDEDQGFWDAVFPASETREAGNTGGTCWVLPPLGLADELREPWITGVPLDLVPTQGTGAGLILFDEISRLLGPCRAAAEDTVGRFLESDEYYRRHDESQFETKTSNGALDDGNNIRIGWEEDLFGDAYHDATAFERCKYGALNVTNDYEGCKSANHYGDSYLILKDVRLRCSFAATDSGGIEGAAEAATRREGRSRLAVLDKYAHAFWAASSISSPPTDDIS